MSDLPASIAGFTIIPVAYSSSTTHVMYARSHTGSKKSQKKTFPSGRTLFLVNVPPDATERELTLFFKHAGTVEKVIFDNDEMEWHETEQSDSESEGEEAGEMEDESQEQPRKKRKVTKEDKGPPKVSPLPRIPLRTLRRTGGCAHVIFLDSSSSIGSHYTTETSYMAYIYRRAVGISSLHCII